MRIAAALVLTSALLAATLLVGGCSAPRGSPASVVRQPWMTQASPTYRLPPPGPQAP